MLTSVTGRTMTASHAHVLVEQFQAPGLAGAFQTVAEAVGKRAVDAGAEAAGLPLHFAPSSALENSNNVISEVISVQLSKITCFYTKVSFQRADDRVVAQRNQQCCAGWRSQQLDVQKHLQSE
jgi:hypothetical protein